MDEMTEKEMKSIKMSTLYELRLLFTQGEKDKLYERGNCRIA